MGGAPLLFLKSLFSCCFPQRGGSVEQICYSAGIDNVICIGELRKLVRVICRFNHLT